MRNLLKTRVIWVFIWVSLSIIIFTLKAFHRTSISDEKSAKIIDPIPTTFIPVMGIDGSAIFWQNQSSGGVLRNRTLLGDNVPPEVLNSPITELRLRDYPRSVRRETCNRCYVYDFRPIIEADVCKTSKGELELMILITSKPRNQPARDAIRKTWGSLGRQTKPRSTVRILFLFGTGWDNEEQDIIQQESYVYRDIQQDDYIDSYYNLSTKVIGGFHWVQRKCRQAKFILRTADDNYINLPRALAFLRKDESRLMHGFFGECVPWNSVYRDPYNKWFVTRNEFPGKGYPPCCVGTAFYVSYQTMMNIIKVSPYIPYFPLEDIYFGLLAKYGLRQPNIPVPGYNIKFERQKNVIYSFSERHRMKCVLPSGWHHLHPVGVYEQELLWDNCQEMKDEIFTVHRS